MIIKNVKTEIKLEQFLLLHLDLYLDMIFLMMKEYVPKEMIATQA